MAGADAAQEALDLVGRDPHAALAAADAIVATVPRPSTPEDVRQVATAHRAAGLALRSLGDPVAAEKRMRRGVAVADRGGLDEVAAEVRMSMAFVLLDLGRYRAASAAADQSLAVLRGVRAARARVIRALVLQRTGRHREAMQEYADSLPLLRRAHDRDWEARLRHNRALLAIELGETRSALADLEWVRSYDLASGHTADAADSLFNMGVAMQTAGDVPGALALYDRAAQEWGDLIRPELLLARVDAYLSVGLVLEATDNARIAAEWLQRRGWDGLEAAARLSLALCLLSSEVPNPVEAEVHARRAQALLSGQGRHEARDRAEYVALKAALLARGSQRDLDGVGEMAGRLKDTGRDFEAADLRMTAGRVALEQGDDVRAHRLLGPLVALDRSRDLEIRSRALLARSVLLRSRGEVRDAHRTLRSAWNVVEQQRSRLGATELRSSSAGVAGLVAAEGLALAVSTRSATSMFEWAERNRAAVLRYPPVAPPRDAELAKAVARLRWANQAEFDAVMDGEVDPAARRVRAESERTILRLTRQSSGAGERPASSRGAPAVRWRDVRDALAPMETFVQLVESGERLYAITVGVDGIDRTDLGSVADMTAASDTMTFGLRRALLRFGTASSGTAVGAAAARAAASVDGLLTSAAVPAGAGAVVVCPTARLAGMPWALLPSLRTRALSVAPSASVWVAARGRGLVGLASTEHVVSVSGPGLVGGADEARRIARMHDGSVLLVGDDASPAAVARALPSATTLHVAAHGTVRLDNPLFSSIQLAGGALTVYDIEAAGRSPATVTMSACSSGLGHASIGEECLGFVWTLMGMGSQRVVAPLLPVPDAATSEVMVDLHRGLTDGWSPAARLAELRTGAPELALVASAFVAYGR